jgi:hypothetical protein
MFLIYAVFSNLPGSKLKGTYTQPKTETPESFSKSLTDAFKVNSLEKNSHCASTLELNFWRKLTFQNQAIETDFRNIDKGKDGVIEFEELLDVVNWDGSSKSRVWANLLSCYNFKFEFTYEDKTLDLSGRPRRTHPLCFQSGRQG